MVKLKNNYELKNEEFVSFQEQYTTGQKLHSHNIYLIMNINFNNEYKI
jgi:hypothetical protein